MFQTFFKISRRILKKTRDQNHLQIKKENAFEGSFFTFFLLSTLEINIVQKCHLNDIRLKRSDVILSSIELNLCFRANINRGFYSNHYRQGWDLCHGNDPIILNLALPSCEPRPISQCHFHFLIPRQCRQTDRQTDIVLGLYNAVYLMVLQELTSTITAIWNA